MYIVLNLGHMFHWLYSNETTGHAAAQKIFQKLILKNQGNKFMEK